MSFKSSYAAGVVLAVLCFFYLLYSSGISCKAQYPRELKTALLIGAGAWTLMLFTYDVLQRKGFL